METRMPWSQRFNVHNSSKRPTTWMPKISNKILKATTCLEIGVTFSYSLMQRHNYKSHPLLRTWDMIKNIFIKWFFNMKRAALINKFEIWGKISGKCFSAITKISKFSDTFKVSYYWIYLIPQLIIRFPEYQIWFVSLVWNGPRRYDSRVSLGSLKKLYAVNSWEQSSSNSKQNALNDILDALNDIQSLTRLDY